MSWCIKTEMVLVKEETVEAKQEYTEEEDPLSLQDVDWVEMNSKGEEGYAEEFIDIKEECGEFKIQDEIQDGELADFSLDEDTPNHFTDNLNCDLCEYVGTTLSSLKYHKTVQHKTMCSSCTNFLYVLKSEKGKIIKCESCKKFLEKSKINAILVKNSLNQIVKNAFVCEECKYATGQAYGLILHRESQHPKPCDECEYISTTSKLLNHHKEINHKISIYSCDQCEYSATKARSLKRHKRSVHEGVRYTCDLCEYSATTAGNLNQHKRSVHGVRCTYDLCEYSTASAGNLNQHKRSVHEGVRYTCDLCEYSATTARSLKQHKRSVHEGVSIYSCDQCEFSATTARSLKRHKRSVHEGVRYTCDLCEYSATRAYLLKRHKKKKHLKYQ